MEQIFPHPAQQVACQGYLDAVNQLVPSEHSSRAKRRQGAITKAGSPLARLKLVEGAWSYQLPARVFAQMRPRLAGWTCPGKVEGS